jgi:1,4-dihydroxy-2-naphthoate octaprenyltransferase
MPVFMFAFSEIEDPDWGRSILIFFILHFLVYPSSNGYNSFMDRDIESIGGIENPLPPTRQLFIISNLMDALAIALSFLITPLFALGIIIYILASKAYSYRGIRLKRYPFTGFLTVILFQGALIFWIVFHGGNKSYTIEVPTTALIASSLLIGGFYPLTQIYQHESDRKDGVISISALLGYRGTFIFTAAIYIAALAVMAKHFSSKMEINQFLILTILMSPIIVYFIRWAIKVWITPSAANFKNTMRMTLIACFFTNLAFFILVILKAIE